MERSFIVENDDYITQADLPVGSVSRRNRNCPYYSGPLDFGRFKEQSEKEFVKALRANGGKINKTVALANIPKNTLLRKIKRYGELSG